MVHFPESAISGCAKAHIKSWEPFDWNRLVDELETTAELARTLGLWVVLGSCHRLSQPHRPHNSLYVISDRGELATRYDKQYCSHTEITHWYTPGRASCVFEVGGWRFACALCIEIQFAELFQAFAAHDVDCVLFSAFADDAMFGIQAQGYAASHNYWISLSTPVQMSHGLPSRLIAPNGAIQALATQGHAGLVVGELDENDPRWEVALHRARPWRARARSGEIYRHRYVEDSRSEVKTEFSHRTDVARRADDSSDRALDQPP